MTVQAAAFEGGRSEKVHAPKVLSGITIKSVALAALNKGHSAAEVKKLIIRNPSMRGVDFEIHHLVFRKGEQSVMIKHNGQDFQVSL